jgi:hypothetical protein
LSCGDSVLSRAEVTKLAIGSDGYADVGFGEFNRRKPYPRILERMTELLEAGPRQNSVVLDRPAEVSYVKKIPIDEVRCPQGDEISTHGASAGSSPQCFAVGLRGSIVQARLHDLLHIAVRRRVGHQFQHWMPIARPNELVLEPYKLRHPSCPRLQTPPQVGRINVDDERCAERAPRGIAIDKERMGAIGRIFKCIREIAFETGPSKG